MSDKAGMRRGERWTLAVWGGAGLLLVAPVVAMQFSEEMNWTAFDFAFLGALLAIVALGVELAVRRSASAAYRIAAATALAVTFFLVLINGAVGVIGGDDLDANRLYVTVPAVALLGAAIARFRPAGMAWAMVAAAAAQVLVPVAAAVTGAGPAAAEPEVLALTAVFSAAWLFAAWQFRRAPA